MIKRSVDDVHLELLAEEAADALERLEASIAHAASLREAERGLARRNPLAKNPSWLPARS